MITIIVRIYEVFSFFFFFLLLLFFFFQNSINTIFFSLFLDSNLNQVPNINNNHSNSSNNNNNELLASPKPQDIVNPVFFGSYDEDSLDSDSSGTF